ncbi:MAG: class I SAM-dependent methyltransferase, partial [Proteobacteria bacterium]|nr:class I SAM-dependent methyltransferase [Pseudomonadota bacterium]
MNRAHPHIPVNELLMPPAEACGFVPTLNGHGYMTNFCDGYMRAFVNHSAQCLRPVIDIGAAYGIATLGALANGATVIANDLDIRHLQILEQRVEPRHRTRLRCMEGAFPFGLSVDCGSLDAALLARVAHFFDGPKLTAAVETLWNWLAPGGHVFLTAETPYLGNFRDFIPIYEQRRKAGAEWPGYIEDVQRVTKTRGAALPPTMHFLDPEV